MRKFYIIDEENNNYIIIGTAREIKSLEKRMREKCWKTEIYPTFYDPAKYNMEKIYGIDVYTDHGSRWFSVINENCIAQMLLENII